MKHFSVARMTRVGALGAIAAILYAIPGIPIIGFYKLDFSTVPALIAALVGGPIDSIVVLLIKDVTGLAHSSSTYVGEIADFLCSAALCLPICLMRRLVRKELPYKVIASAISTLIMTVVGCLVNYFIMIPFYVKLYSAYGTTLETIVSQFSEIIPAVDSLTTLICFVTAPFNLLKGAAVCLISFPVWSRLPQK